MLEKPESLKAEGLCAVRSSKAARLTHIKKGYYHPPGKPIFVASASWDWLALGWPLEAAGTRPAGGITVVDVRGPLASHEKDENCKLVRLASQRWGRTLLHLFDRGFSGSPWLGALRGFNVRFIVRVA